MWILQAELVGERGASLEEVIRAALRPGRA
jgi:hypothetical protein